VISFCESTGYGERGYLHPCCISRSGVEWGHLHGRTATVAFAEIGWTSAICFDAPCARRTIVAACSDPLRKRFRWRCWCAAGAAATLRI